MGDLLDMIKSEAKETPVESGGDEVRPCRNDVTHSPQCPVWGNKR